MTAWGRSRRLRRWAMRVTVACGAAAALAILALMFFPVDNRAVTLLEQAVIALGLLGVAAGVLTLSQPRSRNEPRIARWSLLVLVVVAADLVWAAWGLNPTVPASFYEPIRAVEDVQARALLDADAEETVKFEQFFRFDNYLTAVAQQAVTCAPAICPTSTCIDRVPLLNNFEPLLVGHFAEYIDLLEATPKSGAADRRRASARSTMPDGTAASIQRMRRGRGW